ncbi:MAG: hypothetical protein ACM3PY_18550 [Omnitrophica WOR_2 bacterium]
MALMKKAVRLKVTVTIEGMDEPAHNFAQSSTRALEEIIAAGEARYPNLSLKIEKIEEDSGEDE